MPDSFKVKAWSAQGRLEVPRGVLNCLGLGAQRPNVHPIPATQGAVEHAKTCPDAKVKVTQLFVQHAHNHHGCHQHHGHHGCKACQHHPGPKVKVRESHRPVLPRL